MKKKELKYISINTLEGGYYVCYPKQNEDGNWMWDGLKLKKSEALKRYPRNRWSWSPLSVAF